MFEKDLFAKHLRQLRIERGMSQSDLANVLGVSKFAISDMERSRRTTTLEKLYEICQFFDVSIDYLLGNGLYAKEEELLKFKKEILSALGGSSEIVISDYDFLRILSVTIADIVIQDGDTPEIQIYPQVDLNLLRPLFETFTARPARH
jgi:transcriptional regulator with XRE-family HTH domain